MQKLKPNVKKILLIVGSIVLGIGLCVSIAFNIYFGVCYIKGETYLQSTEEIYIMEAGILRNNLQFHDGTDYELQYNFTHENYAVLKSKYKLESTAKDGTEFEKALRLMDEYAPRLTHDSYYDNHIPMNASDLLAYSLNNKKHGINCRAKAQILNEMCLSLGIYSRKVWIMPYSDYDNDCHVVNEVWDGTLNKWVMLDITNNEYWVDENNTPLSVLEIRSKAALNEFCTPVEVGDKTNNLQKLKNKNIGDFLYIVKNMVYMRYCTDYTVGESQDKYMLLPQNMPTEFKLLISIDSVERSPIK
ncbi:MAG: transglutaminase-like domain-containing protein [Clostridia bacterium]|nr:transglutaminase-like domain-containing protein [Clostridia bacterium]